MTFIHSRISLPRKWPTLYTVCEKRAHKRIMRSAMNVTEMWRQLKSFCISQTERQITFNTTFFSIYSCKSIYMFKDKVKQQNRNFRHYSDHNIDNNIYQSKNDNTHAHARTHAHKYVSKAYVIQCKTAIKFIAKRCAAEYTLYYFALDIFAWHFKFSIILIKNCSNRG